MRRKFEGEVVAHNKNKTATVKVESVAIHPKYKKRYTKSKKFLVHDPANSAVIGSKVSFVETRPISRRKRWAILTNEKA